MEMFPETAEITIEYAFFVSFIGMGFGLIIGVACRAFMTVVNIIKKFIK